ncbi:MAG: M15 family metallopeptidase [Candidatus Aureabacteria bacterium]|nr:M15 family metallopeptidase [Candidatus Auribacterota bacterium]
MKRYSPEIEYLTGRFKASRHASFRKVKFEYTGGSTQYLLKEAADSFEKMAEEAKKDKITLFIVSGFRSFNRQKRIWEDKYLGVTLVENKNLRETYPNHPEKRIALILKYSSIPGTSRHHWGTDLDINSVSPSYFNSGEGKKIHEWLEKNASRYGFFQPYTPGRSKGYETEPWHWSYKKISKSLLKKYLSNVTKDHIKGFEGDSFLPDSFLEDYVKGINHD